MRLIHGDCIEEINNLIKEGEEVDLVLTDPPYGIDYTPTRETSKFHNTKVVNDDNLYWLPDWVECIKKISKNIVAVFVGWTNLGKFQAAFEDQGFTLKNVLVWDKKWFGMGANYRPVYELIMLLCKTNFTIESNNKSNILPYRKVAPNKLIHSCEKPVDLLVDLVSELSDPGDVVLDCFMGSGSTGVACCKTGREFIGIEIEERYYNIAKDRISEEQSQKRLM